MWLRGRVAFRTLVRHLKTFPARHEGSMPSKVYRKFMKVRNEDARGHLTEVLSNCMNIFFSLSG